MKIEIKTWQDGVLYGLAAAGFVILLVAAVTWKGYVLSILWAWFVVPLGVAALSIPHAIGLAILGAFLVGDKGATREEVSDIVGKPEKPGDRIFRLVANITLYPAFALGLGWVVRGFM